MLRNDAPVIRYLCEERGIDTALQWQRKPYVVFPERKSAALFKEAQDNTPTFVAEREAMPNIDILPWNDFVIDLGKSFEALFSMPDEAYTAVEMKEEEIPLLRNLFKPFHGMMWARVTDLGLSAKAISRPEASATLLDRRIAIIANATKEKGFRPEEFISITLYTENALRAPGHLVDFAGGMHLYEPFLFIIPKFAPWDRKAQFAAPWGEIEPEGMEIFGETIKSNIDLVLAAISHILYGFEYAVEVRPAKTAERKTKPTLKPWTREDLPRIILIDPAEIGQYRKCSAGTGKTNASARPHQRRAHYRTLRAERFGNNCGKKIAIRQAWIGDTEWEHEGQIYKVLPTPATVVKP